MVDLRSQLILQTIFTAIQPYWFLVGHTYSDTKYNEWTRDTRFQINDALLMLQIFFKLLPAYVFMVTVSKWNDPKSQRCCSIFGVKANFLYGLKALMIQDPIRVVIYSFFLSLIQLGLSLQIFEREVDENFKNLTTSLWTVIITLTSVGYGDYYPKSDMGRLIGIITAFWGVFFLSLFVVALTNTLELSESDQRAFILLRRLFTRESMKE